MPGSAAEITLEEWIESTQSCCGVEPERLKEPVVDSVGTGLGPVRESETGPRPVPTGEIPTAEPATYP